MKATWFIATIITQCEIEGESFNDEWMCSQDIFVIRAPNRDIAYDKAVSIGRLQEHSYLNDDGQTVAWKFVGLENLEELPAKAIHDGIEVWGRIFYSSDPYALVVEQAGLSVFYNDEIKGLTAAEILKNGQGTKLVCNRIQT